MARLITRASASLLLAAAFLAAEASSFDYAGAFDKCLQFFEAQRPASSPATAASSGADSALTDGFSVDLVGGYYDSGDHVKFGFPMAYAVTMLSWGVLEFEKEMIAADNLNGTLDAIRWGTNYFVKAHTEPNALWVQVGDGDSDHLCWERAEDMATPRTAFKIDTDHPGSEVAGETAAALAAAAKAFRPYDSMYSDLLLLHAKQLLWAAAWLYEATGDQNYLHYVSQNAEAFGGTGWAVLDFSCDNKYAGLQVLLSKVLFEGGSAGYADTLKQYQAKAEFFLCACLQKNNGHNIKMTPGGLLYVDDWNNMQYVSSSTFLLTVYADYLAVSLGTLKCPDGEVKPSEILSFAKFQVDYTLGKNPKAMSYMVGYGSIFPTHVHHRGASIPSIYAMSSTVGCMDGFDKYYNSKGADPNVLHGALVGGPDGNDGFVDDRCNYQHAEPTLAGNAPICGVFARLAAEPTDASDSSPAYAPPQDSSPSKGGSPLELVHTVSNSWNTDGVDYYRHVLTAKNTCGHPITYLKLHIKELCGPIYGVSGTQEKDMYELPSWLARLEAGEQLTIVYIQGGAAAKISVANYKTA